MYPMRASTGRARSAAAAALAIASIPLLAQDAQRGEASDDAIEEVLVTAQRVAESVQDVPIAVTALTGEMLDDRQVVTTSDVQMNAPNVSFSATNFGGSSFSIRGIGNLVVGRTGESGVSFHLNEVPVITTNFNAIEFFDMERVEVLRGPQGTLFGRNATGGVVNLVTRKPSTEGMDGFLDVESGSYRHRRVKGAVNLPLGNGFALRLAGFQLDRQGYIENLAYGQTDASNRELPGIDRHIDGRDITALRATLSWQVTDRLSAWVLGSLFTEDDDRARITSQVCARNSLPTNGCLADGFGWDTPHMGAVISGIFGGAIGALPLGASGADTALYDYARPAFNDFRKMHTDFDPIFQNDEKLLSFGVHLDLDAIGFSLIGAESGSEYLSRQDYLMDVGARLAPTPANPDGLYPVSEPAGGSGVEWRSADCNLTDGTSGILGGCILPTHQNRLFAYDQQDWNWQYRTLEAKMRSSYDGPFNFLLGVGAQHSENYGGYYVLGNTLDQITLYGSDLLGMPPLYPGFFYNANDPENGSVQDSETVFGEVYYDFSDRLTMTAGLRFNHDSKQANDTSVLFNSADVNAVLGGLLGAAPIWLRLDLLGEMSDMAANPSLQLSESSARLLQFWDAEALYAANAPAAIGTLAAVGAAQALGAQVAAGTLPAVALPGVVATLGLPAALQSTVLTLLGQDAAAIAADPGLAAGAAAFAAIADALGPVPGFRETRYVTNNPIEASWKELSGRFGFDFRLDDDTLLYGFFSHGYKPGGFNPAIQPAFQDTTPFTFDAEQVNALEAGIKKTLLDGRLILNGTTFLYDYSGLQVTRIRNNSSINENIDANLAGLEIDGVWRPQASPGTAIDFSYGWLSSAVEGSMSIDPINRAGGNAEFIVLNNIDPGAETAINYVARESQITNAVVLAALQRGAALDIRNGIAAESVSYPANAAGVSIPAYFSRQFLTAAGVETLEGVPVDLDGNQLPNAPEHTLKIGIAHTWNVPGGSLTGRWDWYWQGESYAREFNTRGDAIDSWSQHNAALVYERKRWSARAWVRNILDDDNVTGKYLTSDTSGLFRNYFLTEPRIFGASVRVALGAR